MEIIQIHQPLIKIDEENILVQSTMFKDLIGFQDEINEREKAGYNKCYLFSIYTQHEPDNHIIYWVRRKYIK